MHALALLFRIAGLELGQDLEQTTEFLDNKEVDGVQIPFRFRTTSSVQTIDVRVTKVEHNVAVDQALFSKPAP